MRNAYPPGAAALAAVVLAISVATVGCGAESAEPSASTTFATVPVPSTARPAAADAVRQNAPQIATAPAITAIDSGATVTEPAERLDDDIVVTWIGGSDIELDGRSLPDAVEPLLAEIGDRSVVLDVDAVNAPLPNDVAVGVERAADRNVDALVVSMSPSWSAWDGHDECAGITPPHDYYLCVLRPRPTTDVAALEADLAAMVDAIVATGVPAYVYVIPHSSDALANPTLEPRLADAESVFERIAPSADQIGYSPMIITRGVGGLREGAEFFDMVHPTPDGIQRLAALFADELDRFLAEQLSS